MDGDLPHLTWRRSPTCRRPGGVETAPDGDHRCIRDPAAPHRPALRIHASDWRAFLATIHGRATGT